MKTLKLCFLLAIMLSQVSCQEICDTPSGGALVIVFYDKTTGEQLQESDVKSKATASTDLLEQPDIIIANDIYVDFSSHACTRDTVALRIFWDSTLVETVHFRLLDIGEVCDNRNCCDPCYVVNLKDIRTDQQSELDDITLKVKI